MKINPANCKGPRVDPRRSLSRAGLAQIRRDNIRGMYGPGDRAGALILGGTIIARTDYASTVTVGYRSPSAQECQTMPDLQMAVRQDRNLINRVMLRECRHHTS